MDLSNIKAMPIFCQNLVRTFARLFLLYSLTPFFHNGEEEEAETKVQSAENLELQCSLKCRPAEGENIALHSLPVS